MAPTVCFDCKEARAVIIRPKNRRKLCRACFIKVFETEVHETIIGTNLFFPGERVAIGASGGKDSTVLAAVLKTLNERYNYGLDLCLLSIDEASYMAGRWTRSWNKWAREGNCTYCGVFRRQALDRGAARLGIKHVVTGHNADDVAETVMMNLLRGDLPPQQASQVRLRKREIVLYAHHRQLDYFTTECIYSPEAFRGSARTLIKDLEKIRPSSILDIVKSGEDMAALVPVEVRGAGQSKQGGAEEESAGGCGSQNGRTSGGEMAAMEKQLTENDAAESLETEIKLPTGGRVKPNRGPTGKAVKAQTIKHCERCNYISSQRICKACTLLDGLNRNRPKTAIEVGVGMEDEESSSTLMRQMERAQLSAT
ncbi:tRNA(Ile)-lysidine/2-thiocytidine synthase [Penicillium expansum]|nr:tRNA(Ile)-lysidine/2-thiocytidine synthase [Penicillium expansum]